MMQNSDLMSGSRWFSKSPSIHDEPFWEYADLKYSLRWLSLHGQWNRRLFHYIKIRSLSESCSFARRPVCESIP